MFLDFSSISYFIFSVCLILPIIFGLIKGWRVTLFFFVITILLCGVFFLIFHLIYNSALWPLFKKTYIVKHNSLKNLNVDYLRDSARLSIMSLFTAISLLISIALSFIGYLLFKTPLTRSMKPTVNVLSDNSVKIDRKKTFNQRLLGGGVGLIAGLTMTSTLATSMSTIFTNYKKSNFFNDFANTLSLPFSFYQSKYDENFQNLNLFLKEANSYEVKIKNLIDLIEFDENDFPTQEDLNLILKNSEFLDRISQIGKSKVTARDFLNYLASIKDHELPNNQDKDNPIILSLLPDYYGHEDDTSEQIDNFNEQIGANLEKIIQLFVSQGQTRPLLPSWNIEGINLSLLDIFYKWTSPFEASFYYQEFKISSDKLTGYNDHLNNLIHKDIEDNQKLSDQDIKIHHLESQIKDLAYEQKSAISDWIGWYKELGDKSWPIPSFIPFKGSDQNFLIYSNDEDKKPLAFDSERDLIDRPVPNEDPTSNGNKYNTFLEKIYDLTNQIDASDSALAELESKMNKLDDDIAVYEIRVREAQAAYDKNHVDHNLDELKINENALNGLIRSKSDLQSRIDIELANAITLKNKIQLLRSDNQGLIFTAETDRFLLGLAEGSIQEKTNKMKDLYEQYLEETQISNNLKKELKWILWKGDLPSNLDQYPRDLEELTDDQKNIGYYSIKFWENLVNETKLKNAHLREIADNQKIVFTERRKSLIRSILLLITGKGD